MRQNRLRGRVGHCHREALQERAAERRRAFIFGYTCVNDVTAAEVLN